MEVTFKGYIGGDVEPIRLETSWVMGDKIRPTFKMANAWQDMEVQLDYEDVAAVLLYFTKLYATLSAQKEGTSDGK